jgi:GT2 family glycosyltransferase
MPVTVVIATRNRREHLLSTLARLHGCLGVAEIIVVDNGSQDSTAAAVNEAYPEVRLIRLETNMGAVARNIGVWSATTPLVAFSDDDSWWAPKALLDAETTFDADPRLAVLQARILVGDAEQPDPVCELMARSPLARPAGSLGPALLGFIACGAIVRRDAFLSVGGFSAVLGFLGEEQLLAMDLAARGLHVSYLERMVAYHHPLQATDRNFAARQRLQTRNALLTTWMRRPARIIVRDTLATVRARPAAAVDAVRRLPAALAKRRRLPAEVEAAMRRLENRAGQRSVRR